MHVLPRTVWATVLALLLVPVTVVLGTAPQARALDNGLARHPADGLQRLERLRLQRQRAADRADRRLLGLAPA